MRAARDGANIAVLGKTDAPHPRLPGTVPSSVAEIEAAGGHAIGCITDIRFEDQGSFAAVGQATVWEFGEHPQPLIGGFTRNDTCFSDCLAPQLLFELTD